MKRLLILTSVLYLSACGFAGPCGNGDPFAIFQYCKKRIEYYYGAHWIKEGVTKDQRRADSWACGAANTVIGADGPVFTKEQKAEATLPTDKNELESSFRVEAQWATCMESKGYVYLGVCDARCL